MKRTNPYAVFLISLLAFVLIGCLVLYLLGPAEEGEVVSTITTETPLVEMEATMELTSSAFGYGQPIPAKFSCKGADVSPALAWDEPPTGTQSFALIMDDPDAPIVTWVHWVLFNIPASARELPESVPTLNTLADGSMQGTTSAGHNPGYHGPCPPSGTHRYFFKLYALDTTLDLSSGANKGAVLSAMKGHILAQAELMGTFSK